MKHLPIIYLDVEFITSFYEESKGITLPTRVTKTADFSSGISAAGFISLGASTKEQKEYPLDAHAMYDELRASLDVFPHVDLTQVKDSDLPEVFWLDGVFGMAQSSLKRGAQEITSAHYYQFVPSIVRNDRFLNLATNDIYFSSGYDQLSKYGPALACDFAIQAKMLVRLLFYDDYYAVAAPVVILKSKNAP